MAASWAYYDAKGNRVRKQHAVFAGREVAVDTGVPAPPGHASLHGLEYQDVHLVAKPDDRRTFKSRRKMVEWFEEAAKTS